MGGYFFDVAWAVRGPLALPQSYQSEDPIRSLKKCLPARASFTSICDHNHGEWHLDFHCGCLAMFRLFCGLSHIMAPNENPEGLDDDEAWEHPDRVSSVEDQIKSELNDFPFLVIDT